MTERTASGVSRRGFLLAMAAACCVGVRQRRAFGVLDDACVRRMAVWAG